MTSYRPGVAADAAAGRPVQVTSASGERVWVGQTDTCAHCLAAIRRAYDGYQLPNGDPSFTWGTDVDGGVIECPRHHWVWDARTGQCVDKGTVPLRVEVLDPDAPALRAPTEPDG